MLAAERRVRTRAVRPAAPAPRNELRRRLPSLLVWTLVAAGIGARVYQFAWNRSLFLDEAALALNLRDRSFLELFGHLDHAQFAPIGFLLLQKTLVALFGAGSIVGMVALSIAIAIPLRISAIHLGRLFNSLAVAIGGLSCALGLLMICRIGYLHALVG